MMLDSPSSDGLSVAKPAGPLLLGEASLALHPVPAAVMLRCQAAPPGPFEGLALLASDRAAAVAETSIASIPDGNRAACVPVEVEAWGRRWALGIKGVGAGGPLYGDDPLSGLNGRPLRRPILRESWMGESPFGGQGEPNARAAVARTDESLRGVLFGMPICPVIAVVEIPESMIEPGHHYRRFDGPVVAEHRLVPSNLRLFHGTGRGLGQAPLHFLRTLGLTEAGRFHAFVETLLSTGLGALGLFAASLREGPRGLQGLDFDDAWLDKDSLVASDGSLHFVDLESLDWVTVRDAAEAHARMARQLARNAYDLFFAADALFRAYELERDEPLTDTARRGRLRELFVMAMDRPSTSPRVAVEESPRGLSLLLHTVLVPDLALPLMDVR